MLFYVHLGALFSLTAHADEGTVKIVYLSSQKRPDIHMVWDANSFRVEKKPKANPDIKGKFEYQTNLKGKFLNSDWGVLLTVGDRVQSQSVVRSTLAGKPIEIHIPLSGQLTHVTLVAVSPFGDIQKDVFDLQYDNWIEPNPITPPQNTLCQMTFCIKLFQFSPSYFFNAQGFSGSAMAAWTPYYDRGKFRIRANLGVLPFKGPVVPWFFVLEYSLAGSVQVWRPLWIETLVGMQFWSDYSTHSPIVGANIVYRLNRKILLWIDQFSAGYSVFCSPGNATHNLRLGVGLSF
jgi:hypothetical protein